MRNDSTKRKISEIAEKIKETSTIVGPDGKKYVSEEKMQEQLKKAEKKLKQRYGIMAGVSIALLISSSLYNGVFNASRRNPNEEHTMKTETYTTKDPFWNEWFRPNPGETESETELEVEIETPTQRVREP